jgi:hypothetical protein
MTIWLGTREEEHAMTGGPLELTIVLILSATAFLSAWHFVEQLLS